LTTERTTSLTSPATSISLPTSTSISTVVETSGPETTFESTTRISSKLLF
jgi:hypothetical protein